jgi:cytochrome c oxidase subunit 2
MPTFIPHSLQAQVISNLFIITLVIGGLIFLIVAGLVTYIIFRFREHPGQAEPQQNFGKLKLEIAWTIAPGLILLVLFVMTLNAMRQADPAAAQDPSQPDMVIIAHQWWWEVHYPKTGAVTANEIHIPAGKPFYTRIESADVIHDFWVPELGRKVDAIPGHPNYLMIQADKPGTYLGTCAEYCGAQHAWMRIRVIAQTQDDFNTWMQDQLKVPQTPTSGLAAEGAKFFAQGACVACHTIAGTNANGNVGPNLTHVASRETIGSGVLDNTPGNLAAWITNPQAIKPGNNMPNLNLPSSEIQALAAYLETLK